MKRDERKIAAVIPHQYHITVMGAIGHYLKRPFFLVADSTNAYEFRDFLRQLKEQIKPYYRSRKKPIILLDNAVAHKTAETMNVLNSKYTCLFLPPYSSTFNSIECS